VISCSTTPDSESSSLSAHTIDLSKIPDGQYEGSAKNGPVKVILIVEVVNQQIKEIEIVKHRTLKGKPAETITDVVIDTQSLEVDAVSGATMSSETILEAIENALMESMKI
jgi:uncharacterized protein with FMN-binding domain